MKTPKLIIGKSYMVQDLKFNTFLYYNMVFKGFERENDSVLLGIFEGNGCTIYLDSSFFGTDIKIK